MRVDRCPESAQVRVVGHERARSSSTRERVVRHRPAPSIQGAVETLVPIAVPAVVPTVMRRCADSGATVPLDARNTQGERERERERNRGTVAAEHARQQRGKCARMCFAALAQERRCLGGGRRHRRLGE